MFNGGKLITQVFIVGMGTVTIASNYIAGSMNSLLLIPGNALCIAATTMVGQAMGRKDTEEAESLMKYTLWLAVITQTILGLVIYPITPAIAGLYSQEPEIIRLASMLFRMSLIVSPHCLVMVLPSAVRTKGSRGCEVHHDHIRHRHVDVPNRAGIPVCYPVETRRGGHLAGHVCGLDCAGNPVWVAAEGWTLEDNERAEG